MQLFCARGMLAYVHGDFPVGGMGALRYVRDQAGILVADESEQRAEEHEVLHGGNVCFPAFIAAEDGAAEGGGFGKDSEGLRKGWGSALCIHI